MAVSYYDILEGKWYIEMSNGEVIPCGSQEKANELEQATAAQIEEYKKYLSERGLMPRLQPVEQS